MHSLHNPFFVSVASSPSPLFTLLHFSFQIWFFVPIMDYFLATSASPSEFLFLNYIKYFQSIMYENSFVVIIWIKWHLKILLHFAAFINSNYYCSGRVIRYVHWINFLIFAFVLDMRSIKKWICDSAYLLAFYLL